MKKIDAKRRDKWILIIGAACVVALVAFLGYFGVWAERDLKRMEARRPILLYEIDHRALLDACREISRQVATGLLEPRSYQIHGAPDPESKQFPQLILDLDPLHVRIEKDGQVNVMMSPLVMYGIRAFPENYEGSPTERYKDRAKYVELIEGLWYYDEDFLKHPEHKEELEELLKKRKPGDSSGAP
jgi:hypothetical protein